MSSLTTYQIRIDEQEKQETFSILHQLGVTPAQAVRMFFAEVRATHSLPFAIDCTPNAKTKTVLSDTTNYSQHFDSVDDLFADLEK